MRYYHDERQVSGFEGVAEGAGLELTLAIYRETKHFPREEMYGLTNQMRRAAVSVTSNIAEGKGKSSDRDFCRFLCHARGSLHELETQFLIARDLGYLREESIPTTEASIAETGKMLNGPHQLDETKTGRKEVGLMRRGRRVVLMTSDW